MMCNKKGGQARMGKKTRNILAVAGLLALSMQGAPVVAQSVPAGTGDPLCENSGLLGPKLFTDICWACLFPIKVAGAQLTPGSAPRDSATQILCACPKGSSGIYTPGVVTSMWEPARIIEHVKTPGCSPTLGGVRLPLGNKRSYGRLVTDQTVLSNGTDGSFFHTHYYSFPLLQILDLYMPTNCNNDGYLDLDIMSFSEIDPTWNNPTLAFFQNPEAAAVANPIAQAACAAETTTLAAGGQPIQTLWWCNGSWGGMYPLSGYTFSQDANRTSGLLASKLLAQQHRRGLARLTMGNSNLCSASIFPTIPKGQYKMTQFMPKAQTQEAMWIGEHPYQWDGGPGRHVPGTHNDTMYMVWRWTDCCNNL